MRLLLLSLIGTVLFAVIGLGWLGSLVYSQLETGSGSASSVEAYQSMGQQLARAIDSGGKQSAPAADTSRFIDHWPDSSPVDLNIVIAADFPVPENLKSSFESGEPLLLEDGSHLHINYFLPSTQQVLTLTLPIDVAQGQGKGISLLLTLVFYFGLIAIVLLWLYPLLRRLILLQRSARAFGAGQLDARIPLSRWTYIGPLEVAFNQMADRVQTLLADNRLLSRAVSHDLKTPLARLRFGFETLEETQDPNLTKRYLARIGHDLDEMESLVVRLLDYAKLEEGQVKLAFERIDLNALVRRVIAPLPEDARRLKIECSPGPLWVTADAHYLKMCLNNLLTNAIQYSQTHVCIRTYSEADKVVVCISDDGPGIPAELRTRVLKPFVRGEGDNSNGHGMGLAIVERIAHWHRARLAIDNDSVLGGASVTLWLPLYDPNQPLKPLHETSNGLP